MKETIEIVSERNRILRQRVRIAGFEDLYVDVPKAFGGEESAPDPHDYFDLSLGACKAITAQMYAQRKQWPLEGVSVRVNRDVSEERKGIYRLEVVMTFHGIEDEAQRLRLEEISHKCPIHRLMTSATVEVTTRSTVDAA
ncbi:MULTISPECIES: OsmC family protein [Halomonadaceae]|uniref:OsmC family protein n=1 Tax=Billgrantia desiderata TaxID=52021 RepID=A0AAW4YR04_9GAMM|nr:MULTISPECIES: OsmC family protein [Halomonas]MCE8011416.1 OsmC family protein [Halomonas desiderata]MCE8027196.1 OsmC family protein [Halomonas desiderata]MCE8040863.1 OsmC family protein [Halomonas desiderata]MCE8045438.1 OsmC family protein [Halomonas desiderata]MCE8050839.1 OsmC family protein [Halomonas desiderata]